MSLLPEINQASAEINKLVAQANIHQTIAPVNPAEFTDPADTALLASRDPVIHEISVGMSGKELTQYTVSGTPPLPLPNSLGKPLKAWSVDVLPYQEGSGDPAPDNVRPIHGTDKVTITTAGKNLLDTSSLTEWSNYKGLTITRNADGSFKLDGTCTETTYQIIPVSLKAGTYCVSGCPAGGSSSGYSIFIGSPIDKYDYGSGETFTLAQDASVNVVLPRVINGTVCNHLLFKPQICLASAPNPTEFTPYLAPSQTVLTLPSTVYTGTIGSEGGESRSAMVDMGDMTWDRVGIGGRFYSNSIRTLVKAGSDADGYDNAFAETYKAQNVASLSFLSDYCMSVDTGGNVQLYDSSKAGMTGAELKTALSGIKMVYKLATPTTFALPAPTIPTPTGTATTWATAEDGTVDSMEVTYIKSE